MIRGRGPQRTQTRKRTIPPEGLLKASSHCVRDCRPSITPPCERGHRRADERSAGRVCATGSGGRGGTHSSCSLSIPRATGACTTSQRRYLAPKTKRNRGSAAGGCLPSYPFVVDVISLCVHAHIRTRAVSARVLGGWVGGWGTCRGRGRGRGGRTDRSAIHPFSASNPTFPFASPFAFAFTFAFTFAFAYTRRVSQPDSQSSDEDEEETERNKDTGNREKERSGEGRGKTERKKEAEHARRFFHHGAAAGSTRPA